MQGERLQLALVEFRTEEAMQILDKMTLMQAQENGVVLDKERLLFIAGGQDNTFNDDVDEALTMFMANLSSANPIYDEAGPSYDSNILSEVQDHDKYLDNIGEYHEVHEMQNNVQQNYVVDLDAEYTSDSNIIQYEQYAVQYVFANEHNKVVNASLTAKFVRYKEQVKIYEKMSRFELTKREQKIDEQRRIIITDRNYKEESLKKELHSVKMQLNSTIGHNKSMREEDKVEDTLFLQDQSLQTVYMLCKPRPYYDEKKKVVIGYKNSFYLAKAMRVQYALYNGHEIVKTHHAPAIVHDLEDTLEIAETTRKKINEKMKDPMCV
ncbi:hypothetical protein Tco_1453802 [Tanacetum coccineum]